MDFATGSWEKLTSDKGCSTGLYLCRWEDSHVLEVEAGLSQDARCERTLLLYANLFFKNSGFSKSVAWIAPWAVRRGPGRSSNTWTDLARLCRFGTCQPKRLPRTTADAEKSVSRASESTEGSGKKAEARANAPQPGRLLSLAWDARRGKSFRRWTRPAPGHRCPWERWRVPSAHRQPNARVGGSLP